MMEKRERLERALLGEKFDRAPIALWRHFAGDDQRIADFVRSTLDFQRLYDWDFIRTTPFSAYCVSDYGVEAVWDGNPLGDAPITKTHIKRSLDWTELRTLDMGRGEMGKYLEALRGIVAEADVMAVPVLATIYSPLSQARMLAGEASLLLHMRTAPQRVITGLNTLTENTLRLVEALRKIGIAGVSYVMDCASFSVMSEEEYVQFGIPYDRKILETRAPKWWLNMLHLAENPMFALAASYPMQVINWDVTDKHLDWATVKTRTSQTLCSGLHSHQHLNFGSPTLIREAMRDALIQTNRNRIIIGANATIPATVPYSHLRMAREAVDILG
ncbi:MAG TPA: uroporphyrinogen decarboxylase family protein [Aggregatilineales bacterium]|nr:uroporphyrinogen decarboxylase family protein [Aggregatilineales bacterium]